MAVQVAEKVPAAPAVEHSATFPRAPSEVAEEVPAAPAVDDSATVPRAPSEVPATPSSSQLRSSGETILTSLRRKSKVLVLCIPGSIDVSSILSHVHNIEYDVYILDGPQESDFLRQEVWDKIMRNDISQYDLLVGAFSPDTFDEEHRRCESR